MIRIKKWIPMLVLLIMLVPTIKVNASTYIAKDDIIIDTKYYDFFKYQFGEDKNYKFFAYNCTYNNYNRTCYYGIDNKNNYVKIDYKNSTNNYEIQITKGVDTNFSVTGNNIINVKSSVSYSILYSISFILVFFVSYLMLSSLTFKKRYLE